MQCPNEIAEIVCEILRTGLLRIRVARDARKSEVEDDHLHNLPALLVGFNPELLHHYWTIERKCFIECSTPDDLMPFEPLWNALAKCVDADEAKALVG